MLAELVPEEFRALGERYLASTRMQRKTGAPMFIDKMPNNFAPVGFLHLILPNSRIIDMRRHPLACCFSNFKQHFARGQHFSYDLADIGRCYRDYVELLAHFDAALPCRVHRVFYERLVADTEAEVRRLLEYCGLPFAESCLQFHASDRPVRTASSEQVRQPIYQDGIDHWRRFERWLDPLKAALQELEKMGATVEVLEAYQTVKPEGSKNEIRAMLEKGDIHMVTFTSSSTVSNFMDMFQEESDPLIEWMEKVTVAGGKIPRQERLTPGCDGFLRAWLTGQKAQAARAGGCQGVEKGDAVGR